MLGEHYESLIRVITYSPLFLSLVAFWDIFLENVYLEIGIDTERYGWMGFIAIFIVLFVLYRNKLQFSGWYKGEGREKLPKIVSRTLIFSSISLILLPPRF